MTIRSVGGILFVIALVSWMLFLSIHWRGAVAVEFVVAGALAGEYG